MEFEGSLDKSSVAEKSRYFQSDKRELSDSQKEFTNFLVKELKSGKIPWRDTKENLGNPKISLTDSVYTGANALKLNIEKERNGYSENRWFTENQLIENSYKIKEGEQAVKIDLYSLYDKNTEKNLDKTMYNQLSSEEKLEYFKNSVEVIPKTIKVYNGQQLESSYKARGESLKFNSSDYDRLLESSQIRIFHNGGQGSYYSAERDSIHIPEKNSFSNKENYYTKALEQIVIAQRVEYETPKELMIADLAVTMLQMEKGGDLKSSDSIKEKATIKSWGEMIDRNPKEFFENCKEAKKVVNHLLENEKNLEVLRKDSSKDFKDLKVNFGWSDGNFGLKENSSMTGVEAYKFLRDIIKLDQEKTKNRESFEKIKIDIQYKNFKREGIRLYLGDCEFGTSKDVASGLKFFFENQGKYVKENPLILAKNLTGKEEIKEEQKKSIKIGNTLIRETKSFYKSFGKVEERFLGKKSEKEVSNLKGIEL